MIKKACCVGVNYEGKPYALRGCITDADNWATLLSKHGFDVSVLAEKQATKENISVALATLIKALGPGDIGYFTFSGHGTWVPCLDKDEPDGRDEALVPIDTQKDGKNLIIDDDIRILLSELQHGARIVTIADCCHSGTVFRFASFGDSDEAEDSDRRVRFLPPSHFIDDTELERRMERAFGQVGSVQSDAPIPGVIHFSGCRDFEYSCEAVINKVPQGAFSHVAVPAFEKVAAAGGSYTDVYGLIRKKLPSFVYQQTPQFHATSQLKKLKPFT